MILCKWSMVTLAIGKMNANLLKMIIGAPVGAKNRESWPPHIPPKQHWIQEQACKCLLQCRCGDLPCLCLFGQMSKRGQIPLGSQGIIYKTVHISYTSWTANGSIAHLALENLLLASRAKTWHISESPGSTTACGWWQIINDHWWQKERCDVIKMMVSGL